MKPTKNEDHTSDAAIVNAKKDTAQTQAPVKNEKSNGFFDQLKDTATRYLFWVAVVAICYVSMLVLLPNHTHVRYSTVFFWAVLALVYEYVVSPPDVQDYMRIVNIIPALSVLTLFYLLLLFFPAFLGFYAKWLLILTSGAFLAGHVEVFIKVLVGQKRYYLCPTLLSLTALVYTFVFALSI